MNEFFREIDDELRRDKATQFWKRWGGVMVGVAVVVVLGVGGWRYWDYLETTRAQQAAAQFYEAGRMIERDDRAGGRDVLEQLASEGGGYAVLARFRLAANVGDADPAAGAQAYDALAGDASVPAALRDLASLRGALLRMDAEPDAAAASLQGLAAPSGAFRHTAREALGLIALRRGDYDRAGEWFDQIAADPEAPQALRGRLEIYSSLVAAGPLEAAR
ncbi:MAG: tetratricopeptide repeat protein [Microvirga sp.]|nr:tetratricopeptide repeat protein [Microvirga sp.]